MFNQNSNLQKKKGFFMKHIKGMVIALGIFMLCAQLHAEEKVFLTAIPKCGTHLVARLITVITGKLWLVSRDNMLHLSDKTINEFNATPHYFLGTHAVASLANIEKVKKGNYKGIFVYRDPRDSVVSFAYYIAKLRQNWPELSQRPLDDIIMEVITNVASVRSYNEESIWNMPDLQSFTDIYSLFDAYSGWMEQPFMYMTKFEKFVGPRDELLGEIINIARHLGIEMDLNKAEEVAVELFSESTQTFRKGITGEWKTHFNEEHKRVFKNVAGQLLIDLGYEKDFNW